MQIDRFEKQNPTISANVFGFEKEKVTILRKSETCKRENIVDLLLINKSEVQHYCVIKNLSRLISSQYNKHQKKKYICRGRLNKFNSEDSIEKHIKHCYSKKPATIEMPKEGSILKFKSFFRKMRVPFVVYADFECFTEKLDTMQPNPKQSYTKQYQKHTSSWFCYYIVYFDNEVYSQNPVIYTKQPEDEDVAQTFVEMLEKDLKGIYMNCGKAKMKIMPKQQRKFQKAANCWICGDKLVTDKAHQDYKKNHPVRDHCHYTGKY